ncbi:MAG TPA: FAD-binding oxidoreductase [Anaerolineales bacterium]|jgi:glycine/D-amino acid oxidase-like deaminating enzyme|nr:FAD-binding oxidoreductase [Anaerolineales bacterium]
MPTQQIYWHTTIQMPDDSNLAPLPEKVDVAVIGGGYTGLSAARMLAKQGVRVAVLEANTIGWGASSRNGGMVLTGLKLGMQTLMKQYGREIAKRLFQCSLDAIDTVERIVREEGIDCCFARYGHLLTANKPGHYDALKEEVEFMEREFDHHLRLIPRDQQRSEVGSNIYFGALLDECSGGLNPAQYVTGLARAVERAGATLHARASVLRLERNGGRFLVATERGSLSAESVLVGTSGYTGKVTKRLQRKIIPIGSFIIATERLSEHLVKEIIPNNRMIFDSRHYLNYFRLWENRLLFGGRAAFFPETSRTIQRSAEILRREMIHVYPQLKDVKVGYVWGGTLDFAFDRMPHVGEIDGIYYSLGYAGHGVAMATYLGKTVAEAMVKGKIKEHPFAQIPFPLAPFGLYNGFPWFLPFAGAWHRILDWVE